MHCGIDNIPQKNSIYYPHSIHGILSIPHRIVMDLNNDMINMDEKAINKVKVILMKCACIPLSTFLST